MATYLLTWNPYQYSALDLLEDLAREEQGNPLRWSTGSSRRIEEGDRVFFLAQGQEPRGIFASGHAVSGVIEADHWRPDREGKKALYVDVKLDAFSGNLSVVFPRDMLKTGKLAEMHWDTQSSGTRIPDEVAEELQRQWARFLDGLDEIEEEMTAEAPLIESIAVSLRDWGAGLAEPRENLDAEMAALDFVAEWYEGEGWNVERVAAAEAEGYDLACSKGKREEQVNVKAVAGDRVRVFLTENELYAAEDPRFVLAVVTSAASATRGIQRYASRQFMSAFDFHPLVYRATLRTALPAL